LLHDILRGNEWLRPHVFLQSTVLLNASDARFVRQVLRVDAAGLAARMRIVQQESERILSCDLEDTSP
jgi:hypothetical protein